MKSDLPTRRAMQLAERLLMSKRNRLAWVDLQRVSGEYELDLVPFGGEEPFTAQQLPSSGRMVLGPFSREDMRTLRDRLSLFLKGEKR